MALATASSVPTPTTPSATTTTTTIVPPATIERVQQAEDDLAQTGEGSRRRPRWPRRPRYNSAALALQIAWLRLLADAGCLTDEQQAEAVEQVTAYTTTLQTELQQVGYYDGPIDGIYGPVTVDGCQDSCRPTVTFRETGFVDKATALALDDSGWPRRAAGRRRGEHAHRRGADRAHVDRLLARAASMACGPTS